MNQPLVFQGVLQRLRLYGMRTLIYPAAAVAAEPQVMHSLHCGLYVPTAKLPGSDNVTI